MQPNMRKEGTPSFEAEVPGEVERPEAIEPTLDFVERNFAGEEALIDAQHETPPPLKKDSFRKQAGAILFSTWMAAAAMLGGSPNKAEAQWRTAGFDPVESACRVVYSPLCDVYRDHQREKERQRQEKERRERDAVWQAEQQRQREKGELQRIAQEAEAEEQRWIQERKAEAQSGVPARMKPLSPEVRQYLFAAGQEQARYECTPETKEIKVSPYVHPVRTQGYVFECRNIMMQSAER